jgi:NTP pyrophosphatase (non-canonical NTP hydrolase)
VNVSAPSDVAPDGLACGPGEARPPHPFDALRARLQVFVAERDWKQFHSPRNLAACLSVEAGELLELYMWTREGPGPHPPGAGPPERAKVEAEAADVLISLLNFCAEAEIDLLDAAARKLAAIERKYPVAQARGVALRADALRADALRADALRAEAVAADSGAVDSGAVDSGAVDSGADR